MEPVTAIRVNLQSVYNALNANVLNDMFGQGGNGSPSEAWNCTRASSYRVSVVSKLKDVRDVAILAVVPQGLNDATPPERWTFCRVGAPGIVDLVIQNDLSSNETLRVSLVGLPLGYTAQSDGKLPPPSGQKFTYSATPQAVPSEALTNGKKRDVGQLNISLNDSNLIGAIPFNVYAKSADLFSTDERDSKSAFSGTLGLQRGVFSQWYSPVHFEQTAQGNQVASNLSTVSTLGLTTLVPWSWSNVLFNNSVIQAPLPPDITVNNQYTYRFRQLVSSGSTRLATDDYSLNPSATWSSISLPWVCRALSSLGAKGTTAPCLAITVDGGAYYLPLDATKPHNARVETYEDGTLMISLSEFGFVTKYVPFILSGSAAGSQVVIKYSDDVTPANNYVRSVSWTFGIQVAK